MPPPAVCYFWTAGDCRAGNECKYPHPKSEFNTVKPPPASQKRAHSPASSLRATSASKKRRPNRSSKPAPASKRVFAVIQTAQDPTSQSRDILAIYSTLELANECVKEIVQGLEKLGEESVGTREDGSAWAKKVKDEWNWWELVVESWDVDEPGVWDESNFKIGEETGDAIDESIDFDIDVSEYQKHAMDDEKERSEGVKECFKENEIL